MGIMLQEVFYVKNEACFTQSEGSFVFSWRRECVRGRRCQPRIL
jgi:hypothetical protein